MNKEEVISKVLGFAKAHQIPLSDIVVGFGGAMVLWGLRESTNDVDLDVTSDVYEHFLSYAKNGHPKIKERAIENAIGGFTISADDSIDIRLDPYRPRTRHFFTLEDDIQVMRPEILLENYLRLNRVKDAYSIATLEMGLRH